jgi:uncharacterized Zn-finger protein
MSNERIRHLWEDFINDNKYKEFFLSNKERWKLNLEQVKKYIDENKKRPLDKYKNKDLKILSMWIYNQKIKYHKKEYIMSNETIRHLWEDFINEYKMYFKLNIINKTPNKIYS